MMSTFLRTLRLHALYPLMSKITGAPNEEERKVAIYRSKRHAIIQCSIHALPVLGAITILGFNLNQYYSKYTDISGTI